MGKNKSSYKPKWLNHHKGYTIEEVLAEVSQLKYFLKSFKSRLKNKQGINMESKEWKMFSNGVRDEVKYVSNFLVRALK